MRIRFTRCSCFIFMLFHTCIVLVILFSHVFKTFIFIHSSRKCYYFQARCATSVNAITSRHGAVSIMYARWHSFAICSSAFRNCRRNELQVGESTAKHKRHSLRRQKRNSGPTFFKAHIEWSAVYPSMRSTFATNQGM